MRLEVQHVFDRRPLGIVVPVRLAVLSQPAQPLPPEPASNTGSGLRHGSCSRSRQRLGPRRFYAQVGGGREPHRGRTHCRLRGAQESLDVARHPSRPTLPGSSEAST